MIDDGSATRSDELEAARMVIQLHKRRMCFECNPDKCWMLLWAQAEIGEVEAESNERPATR